MNVPQIRMESQQALLSIQSSHGNQTIEQKPADLDIQQPKADLFMEHTPPRLTIDQTKAREDVDLKSARKRIEEAAQQGMSDSLAGIARRTQEGDELMHIENGGKPLAAQAKRHSEKPQRDFNIAFLPGYQSVYIDYDPGRLMIDVNVHKPVISSAVNKPEISYTPSAVRFGIKQYQDLKISFKNLDSSGGNVELML